MKSFYVDVPEETCNYLQRLGVDVEGRLEIINRLFTNHANDADASVLTSVPFKKYHEEYNQLNAEYSIAKDEVGKTLRPIVEEKTGVVDVGFNWTIEDFSEHKAKIDIVE